MCQHIPLKFFFKNSIFIEGAQNMSVLWGKYTRIRKLRSISLPFFLAGPWGLWDPSSRTRDWTRALNSESAESWPLDRQGTPFLYLTFHCNLGKSFILLGFTFLSHKMRGWTSQGLFRAFTQDALWGEGMCFKGFLTLPPTPGNLYKKLLVCVCGFFWRSLWLISNCHTSCGPQNSHISCFIEHLLCARHCTKPLCINSYNPHNNPLSWILLLSSFYS